MSAASRDDDPHISAIKSRIRVVPDFPKPGIMFQDITTLLLDPKAFKHVVDMFVERYRGQNISAVAGIEARSFIFGPPIALAIGAKFIPLRKPGKLPSKNISAGLKSYPITETHGLCKGYVIAPIVCISSCPGEVISEDYTLEYGKDCLQMHVGAVKPRERVLVVDDLIATGGTLCAAMNLLERAGAEVVECVCVIEVPDLKGRERLKGKPLFALLEAH